jgi:hypothetical protein
VKRHRNPGRPGQGGFLDSINATPESARERVAVLATEHYHAIIDTEPIYTSGSEVVPIDEHDHISRPSAGRFRRYKRRLT